MPSIVSPGQLWCIYGESCSPWLYLIVSVEGDVVKCVRLDGSSRRLLEISEESAATLLHDDEYTRQVQEESLYDEDAVWKRLV